MGFYITDQTQDRGPRAAEPPWGPKPSRGPIREVISGYRFYNPDLGRWINRDPVEERGGVNIYVFAHNNAADYLDLLGLYQFEIPLPEINTPKISLLLFWIKIKVEGEWTISVDANVSENECPTKIPSNIDPVFDVKGYDNEGFGVNAKFGAEGDNFKAIVGYKVGISTSGNNALEQLWNLSFDKGSYQDIEVELQKWIPEFKYKQYKTPCACVNAKLSVDVEGEMGIYSGRALVAALVAGAVVEPSPVAEAGLASAAASLATMPEIFEQ